MAEELRQLRIYTHATSVREMAQDQKEDFAEIIDFASGYYGKTKLKLGAGVGRLLNWRMLTTEFAPYAREIEQTVDVMGNPAIRGLQHSAAIGCSTQVRDVQMDGFIAPTLMGTLDWEQIGENLASIISLCVLENPIHSDKPVMSASIGPAAFGFFLMNEHLSGKLNRAPLENIFDKNINFAQTSEDDYRKIKGRNANVQMLKTVANSIFTGRQSCSYLLRHAFNKNMNYADTLDYIVNTKTCDFGIITLAGKEPGEATTIEKRGRKTFVRSGYESAANHWDRDGDFGNIPSLPRTLNSYDRAQAMADTSRPSIFEGGHFVFANEGVVDHTTRIIMEMSPVTQRMSIIATNGETPTSQIATGVFDGQNIAAIEHIMPNMA